MKLTPIGVGQAGGKIVDQLASHDDGAELGIVVDALVINSSQPDLVGLRHLPKERRVLVGQSETDGHGVGRDNEAGAEVMNEDIEDVIFRLEETDLDDSEAFLLAAGLGGGMGSGGAPVLAKYLQDRYEKPVYAVGVLPGSSEGNLAARNTMQSLNTLVHHTENVILFDNDEWAADDDAPIEASYTAMNERLVISLATLFGATEPLGGGAVGEQVLDAADLRATLAGGDLSTLGYADTELERESTGFLSGLFGKGDVPDDTADDVRSVLQEATLSRLTAPAPLNQIQSVLGVVAGPGEFLSQKGLDEASAWLDDETNAEEIRMGDYPIEEDDEDGEFMAGIVLLSGLATVDRLIDIYDRVVGLANAPGLEGNEIEATDVMQAFFAGDNSPDPLFVTDETDSNDLWLVDEDVDIDEQMQEDDGFDWRSIDSDDSDGGETLADVNASEETLSETGEDDGEDEAGEEEAAEDDE